MKSFFRYPGGKAKFSKYILGALAEFGPRLEYREPFVGGASIGLKFIQDDAITSARLNDLDLGIYALWKSVAAHPVELKEKVLGFTPSVTAFDDAKAFLKMEITPVSPEEIVETGFNKLVVHQLSYSGLGLKSGGPLGGRKQDSETRYPIDCRWSPEYVCKKIDVLYEHFSKKGTVNITHEDFAEVIHQDGNRVVMYLDPPYYDKGGEVYFKGFDDADHVRLMWCLRSTPHDWVLSYDNCSFIHDLYDKWADVRMISGNYSINTGRQRTELLILKPKSIGV